MALLIPERANLLLLSPEHEGLCPLKEKWFGTQYSVEGERYAALQNSFAHLHLTPVTLLFYAQSVFTDIPVEWSELWAGDFPLNPDLHIPAENKFIGPSHRLPFYT